MSFKSWQSYWKFSSKVKYDQRYIRDEEVELFLSEVLKTSEGRKKRLSEGSMLWRSQIGSGDKPVFYGDEESGDFESCPLPPERMKPLKNVATEGRVNPKGISYIYLATDKETAMSEVRPWIGSEVSVAMFEVIKDLVVIDCSINTHKNPCFFDLNKGFYEPDDEDKEDAVWSHIDKAFSEPVVSNENESHYVPTQIIAELFKRNGYGGVAYKSMLGEGLNICLFDTEAVKIKGCWLFEAKKVRFDFSESANPYSVKS